MLHRHMLSMRCRYLKKDMTDSRMEVSGDWRQRESKKLGQQSESAVRKTNDRRAVHVPGNCQTCAHACPQKAIKLTVPEKNPDAWYRNEHISLQEIIKSNIQKV